MLRLSLLLSAQTAAAASVLVWAPPGAFSPSILNGTLSSVLLALPTTSPTFLTDAPSLCSALLLPTARWLVVPSYASLPLSSGSCAVPALAAFLDRGRSLLAAAGAWPPAFFPDLPLPLLSLNLFSPNAAHSAVGVRVGTREGRLLPGAVNVTSALAFPARGAAVLSAYLPALDARNRTAAPLAASAWLHSASAPNFASSCWVLSGVLAPADFYLTPGYVAELSALVAGCEAAAAATGALPPPLPAADACPCPPRASVPPLPRLLRAPNASHFSYSSNASRWLALGSNVFRDAQVGLTLASTADLVAEARSAGCNALRLYGFDFTTPYLSCALDCATARGMYVLLTVSGHVGDAGGNASALQAHARALALAVANETTIFAVDATNEPYSHDIAALVEADGRSLAQRFNFSDAAYAAYSGALNAGPAFSTFPNLASGTLPPVPGAQAFADNLASMWGVWAGWYTAAFAAHAPATHVCAGFNHWEVLLPGLFSGSGGSGGSGGSSPPLGFACSHAYPDNWAGRLDNATLTSWVPSLLDRLAASARAAHAPHPVLLGETGNSNGLLLETSAPALGLLDAHASAALDVLPHLLSLAHGHSGALRWAVADVELVYAAQGMPWLGNVSEALGAYLREGRFGLSTYEPRNLPSLLGRPKPVVHALRAVRGLLDELQAGGVLQAQEWEGWGTLAMEPDDDARNPLSMRLAYEGAGALVVGAARYTSPGVLQFQSLDSGIALVVVRWAALAAGGQGRGVCVLATADLAGVRVNAAAFQPGLPPSNASGTAWSTVDLLEGETQCL